MSLNRVIASADVGEALEVSLCNSDRWEKIGEAICTAELSGLIRKWNGGEKPL